MESGSGSPCGACKFLRRKCTVECVFAPYFRSENGPARFAAIHKVFGASNASKMLLQLPIHNRYDAVLTIAYEAQARIHDPIRGCVAHISALQQQVVNLQAELMQMRDEMAAHQWRSSAAAEPTMQDCIISDYPSSPDGVNYMQSEIMQYKNEQVLLSRCETAKRRRLISNAHLSELQQMALMMINNAN